MTARDLALRALVTKHVADIAAIAIKTSRAELADEMVNGDRINVTDPDDRGVDLGHVLRTKPRGTAVITDRVAFTTWMAATYPGRVQAVITLPTDSDRITAAVEVLYEHARYLLSEALVIEKWAENEVLKCTERAKEPCGPGGELDVPGIAYEPPGAGVVTVKLSDDAPAAIERLWREGRIDLQSGQVLELEESDML
jgi:hypothetical protein